MNSHKKSLSFEQKLVKAWYRGDKKLILLRPLSTLYQFLQTRIKRFNKSRAWQSPVPVIIIGNITVGGSGKTPAVVKLVNYLNSQGFKPGVISRGYKSQAPRYPYLVNAGSPVKESGDEPLLIARRTQRPVMIGANRKRSIEKLVKDQQCNVIVSDDGLQHYKLQRDIEICVIDLQRGLGNKRCIPEGPLRENISRLEDMDFILCSNSADNEKISQAKSLPALNNHHTFLTDIETLDIHSVTTNEVTQYLQQEIHAVAGIAGPERFFNSLRKQGFEIIEHSFPDHHDYVKEDFQFAEDLPILMTEKDAVKCQHLTLKNAYYQPISMQVASKFYKDLELKLDFIKNNKRLIKS